MDFLHQKNELSQQLDRLQSGQMRAGAMQWGGMNQDTTDDNITRIIEARDSLDAALSILTRRPSDRVHWYHLRRMTPKYATPEQDDWSVPGETSCEAALAYFERHSGPGHRLELCNEGDLRAEFLLEQRQLLQTQHGASHRIRAGALVETFYVCRR